MLHPTGGEGTGIRASLTVATEGRKLILWGRSLRKIACQVPIDVFLHFPTLESLESDDSCLFVNVLARGYVLSHSMH